jgi:F-type H+-transporting ATPase subunit b
MRPKTGMRWLSLMLVVMAIFAMLAMPAWAQEGEAADATAVVEEAEAGGSPLDPLGINAGMLFGQIFNFLVLLAVLTLVLWRPAVNMLDARRATIQKGLEDAAEAARARENAEQEAARVLAEARLEAARIIEDARSKGDDAGKAAETAARAEAERIRTEAQQEALSLRDAELAGVRGQVLSISAAVTQRLIGESLSAKKQQEIVDNFFASVPDAAKGMGGPARVTSAMPLEAKEQQRVKEFLGTNDVTFLVDPAILGGLLIRSGDQVVDGTVKSNLRDLTASLS